MTDAEGYGPRAGQTDIERLLEDARTLSPSGVERVAEGWDQRGDPAAFHEAEAEALRVIERADQGSRWDQLRNDILGLTERGQPLVAWQREHGAIGHKAEDALLAAALALTAGAELNQDAAHVLRRPMAQALPWLAGGAAATA